VKEQTLLFILLWALFSNCHLPLLCPYVVYNLTLLMSTRPLTMACMTDCWLTISWRLSLFLAVKILREKCLKSSINLHSSSEKPMYKGRIVVHV
jgi:hypothetical protein